ncbi:hypothetical protein [Tateyamaria sp.]|uniref:hypothetical protein n=1 Tax=Tateyamaria sp. TaxID=1929288 RepID=UPI00329E7CDB
MGNWVKDMALFDELKFRNFIIKPLMLLAFCLSTDLVAAGASEEFSELYIGTWCGQDDESEWMRVVAADGTYSQFNKFFEHAEVQYKPHVEFGTWSIQGQTLTTKLQGIQYVDEPVRPVEPAWEFEFQIVSLSPEELVIEHTDFDMIFRSTRVCPGV